MEAAAAAAHVANESFASSGVAADETELSRFPRPLLTFAAVTTALLMAAGVAGNLLTVVALLRCPRVRNVAAAFIISLCAADLLFCALVLPFSVSRFAAGTWTHGRTLCVLFPLARYGNVGVSLLSIAMITVNRYIMIAHPALYSRVYRPLPIAAMVAFCWLLSFGMQMPTLLGVWGRFGFDARLGTCSILPDARGRSAKTALFIIAFLTPCAVIVCCYARIFWVVHRSERRLRRHAAARAAGAAAGPGLNAPGAKAASSSSGQREQRARRNEWRITKMVLAIFLSFVLCYLPITAAKVYDREVRYPGWHVTGYLLLYLSACINPVIYVIMNKQYRQAYKSVLTFKRPSRWTITPAPTSSGLHEKSRELASRTLVSQVSLALGPMSTRSDMSP